MQKIFFYNFINIYYDGDRTVQLVEPDYAIFLQAPGGVKRVGVNSGWRNKDQEAIFTFFIIFC